MKSTYKIPSYIDPPGCLEEYLSHPKKRSVVLEIALFQEHRFAFYYWLKWTNANDGIIPSLVTYDWHQDLCPPYKDQLNDLRKLADNDPGEVAFYTWAKLSHSNDVQIYAALLLNKVNDVYVICRQNTDRQSTFTIKDFYGNKHSVFIFKNQEDFASHIPEIKDDQLYFDIDLDYFTLSSPTSIGGSQQSKNYTYLKKEQIIRDFSYSNPSIQFVLDRLAGFTIATEPGFCGGLKKSNMLFHLLENIYFTKPLFNKDLNRSGPEWRHKI